MYDVYKSWILYPSKNLGKVGRYKLSIPFDTEKCYCLDNRKPLHNWSFLRNLINNYLDYCCTILKNLYLNIQCSFALDKWNFSICLDFNESLTGLLFRISVTHCSIISLFSKIDAGLIAANVTKQMLHYHVFWSYDKII